MKTWLLKLMDRVNEASQKYGIKINVKTKVMLRQGSVVNLSLNGKNIIFCYLGSWIKDNGKSNTEIRAKTVMAMQLSVEGKNC